MANSPSPNQSFPLKDRIPPRGETVISVGTRREEEDPIATMKILLERIDLRTRREERVEKKWVAPRGAMKGRSVINARYIRQRFGDIYIWEEEFNSLSLSSNLYISNVNTTTTGTNKSGV